MNCQREVYQWRISAVPAQHCTKDNVIPWLTRTLISALNGWATAATRPPCRERLFFGPTVLGCEKSVAIAKEALETNGSAYDLVLQKGWLTKEALDDILTPEKMTQPRKH